MNRLLKIGFTRSGQWQMEGKKLTFELTRNSTEKNILYAFVSDGEVKYVGKTVRPLSVRMGGYKNPAPTQSTNINNHRRISMLVKAGEAVEIYALPDNGLHHYGDFHLNLAAGLEDAIIETLKPPWNGGKAEVVEEHAGKPAEAKVPAQKVKHEFTLTLQATYFEKGFFNVLVADQQWIGADGEAIEIFLGKASEPVLGSINRRANMNETPRIMGGTAVRDWFHGHAKVMAPVRVEVYSPTSIRLTHAKKL